MNNMLRSTKDLLDHLDELIGVFEDDYNGGDFCAGLTFGYTGSNLLFTMAEHLVKQSVADVHARKEKNAEKAEAVAGKAAKAADDAAWSDDVGSKKQKAAADKAAEQAKKAADKKALEAADAELFASKPKGKKEQGNKKTAQQMASNMALMAANVNKAVRYCYCYYYCF